MLGTSLAFRRGLRLSSRKFRLHQVWPYIWTKGDDWPNNGEIDIIEGVNLMTYNQMAIHTRAGCTASFGPDQTGQAGNTNCKQTAGCTVVRLLVLLQVSQQRC